MSDVKKLLQFLERVCLQPIYRIFTRLEDFRHELVLPNISACEYDAKVALSYRGFEEISTTRDLTCDRGSCCRQIRACTH